MGRVGNGLTPVQLETKRLDGYMAVALSVGVPGRPWLRLWYHKFWLPRQLLLLLLLLLAHGSSMPVSCQLLVSLCSN